MLSRSSSALLGLVWVLGSGCESSFLPPSHTPAALPTPLAPPAREPPLGELPPPPPPPPVLEAPPRPLLGAACVEAIKSSANPSAVRGARDPIMGLNPLDAASPCAKGDAADCEARCKEGSARACKMLGDHRFEAGGPAARDRKGAQESWERACALGDLVGCTSAGAGFRNGGEGQTKDLECAAALFAYACDRGEPQGCWMLGLPMMREKGAKETRERGRALIQKACDAKIGHACHSLGSELAEPSGGHAPDVAGAAVAYKTACSLGIKYSCEKLEELASRGAVK